MKKIAIILCTLMSISAFSQTDFRKGFIINKEKDTVYGLIDNKLNSNAYSFCDFKKSNNSKSKRYVPSEILGYGLDNGRVFTARSIENDEKKSNFFFLEILIKGKATLYKLNKTFFIEKNNDVFKELTNATQKFSRKLATYSKKSKKYVGVLIYLLSDCADFKNDINKTEYREKPLVKLIKKYNDCLGVKNVIYKKEAAWLKINWGVAFGLNFQKLSISGNGSTMYFTHTISMPISYIGGGFIDLSSPRINERFSLYAGIFYEPGKHIEYEKIKTAYDRTHRQVTVDLKKIKIPVGFKYTFPKRILTPYLSAGLSNYIDLNSSTTWDLEKISNDNIVNLDVVVSYPDKFAIGYWLKFGVKKAITKKINAFFEANYDAYSLSNNDHIYKAPYEYQAPDAYTSTSSNVQFLIGLSF